MTHDDLFSRLRMPYEEFAQLGHDDLWGRLRSAEAATLQSMTDLAADRDSWKLRHGEQLAKITTADKAYTSHLAELEAAIAARDSSLHDAADKFAALTNERDGLAEKYSPEIAAEKERVATERKAVEIAAAKAVLAKHELGSTN